MTSLPLSLFEPGVNSAMVPKRRFFVTGFVTWNLLGFFRLQQRCALGFKWRLPTTAMLDAHKPTLHVQYFYALISLHERKQRAMTSLMKPLTLADERPVAEGGEGEAHAGAEGDGGEHDEQTGRAPLSVCNTQQKDRCQGHCHHFMIN